METIGRLGKATLTKTSLAWVLISFLLAACAGGPFPLGGSGPGGQSSKGPGQGTNQDLHEENLAMLPKFNGRQPVRIGLLLPLSAAHGEVGQALLNAARLALFEIGNDDILLIPKDTGGNPVGARTAAIEAMEEGAEILIGPLFSASVREVGPLARARGVPVIAFSTDKTVGGNGVYLLSFLPEQEVRRITEFAFQQGMSRFAALVPQTEYGDRVRTEFQSVILEHGGQLRQMESYPRPAGQFEQSQLQGPARSVAEYDRRKDALGQRKLELGQGAVTSDAAPIDPNQETYGEVSYEAVLLPEGGTYLNSVAPLLPYFDVDPRKVKFLGTGLWDEPNLGKEPSLVGGWFAAPAPEMRRAFSDKYRTYHSHTPIRIASLAFDAVALVASLAKLPAEVRFSPDTISNPNGFSGIDGIFRFLPDGSAERGLAIMQVMPTGLEVVSPAPSTFEEVDRLQTGLEHKPDSPWASRTTRASSSVRVAGRR